jgi:hypothetical protein
MVETMRWLGILIRAAVRERRDLALENLALRQQLAVLKKEKESSETAEERSTVLGGTFSNLGPLAAGFAPRMVRKPDPFPSRKFPARLRLAIIVSDMPRVLDPFRFLLITVAGCMNHRQLQMIDYLREGTVFCASNWVGGACASMMTSVVVWPPGRRAWDGRS